MFTKLSTTDQYGESQCGVPAGQGPSKYMRAQWQNWEERARRQATEGGVIINDIDRKPFESATKFLVDEARADAKLRPLIERIQSVP